MDLVINFAPTGMVPTKAMNPHVPLSVAEIVEDVHRAWEIGITVVHLHARDDEGHPTSSAEVYGRLVAGIRAFAPELVVCVSLSGRLVSDFERRAEPLQLDGALKPDMGSLTLASLNFARQASVNAPETVAALAERMRARGIVPELEAFDAGMVNVARHLARKGILEGPLYFNLLFGNIAGAQADLAHAGLLVRDLPDGALWSFAGLGEAQLTLNSWAIAAGGGVRVGLEDNLWFDAGRTRLASNADLLVRVHELARLHGRAVMPPARFRERLGMRDGRGAFGKPPAAR